MGRLRTGTAAAALLGLSVTAAGEESAKLSPDLHPPVRLEADGKPIDHGAAWGHAGPCVFDVDGDGKRDLVVGDFSGEFTLYKNVGSNDEPHYESAGKLMAGDEPAKVWIYCCIGSSPQFADLDGDGNADLISGSYDPGMCYWFPGNGDGTFRGRGDAKLEVLIRDLTSLKDNDRTVNEEDYANGIPLVDETGKPVLRTPDQTHVIESYGSWPFPVDWDADGDLDLVIGGFHGSIRLRENLGTPAAFLFSAIPEAIEAGGKPIGALRGEGKPGEMHAAVVATDWDGDGLFDLVSGFDDGSVRWFRNVGRKGEPAFAAGEPLVPPHDGSGYDGFVEPGETPQPGIRTQVAVEDMNGDGKPDLIVGDFSQTYSPRDDLPPEDRQAYLATKDRYLDSRKSYVDLVKANKEEALKLFDGLSAAEQLNDENQAKVRKRLEELRSVPEFVAAKEKYETAESDLNSYLAKPESKSLTDDLASAHGFVWLYLRR